MKHSEWKRLVREKLKETIILIQSKGFQSGSENEICLLRKSLYGLKQASRVWNAKIDDVFKQLGFTSTIQRRSLFVYDELEEEKVDHITICGRNPDRNRYCSGVRKCEPRIPKRAGDGEGNHLSNWRISLMSAFMYTVAIHCRKVSRSTETDSEAKRTIQYTRSIAT